MAFVGQSYYRFCSTRLGHRAMGWTVRQLRQVGLIREFRLCLDALELDHDAVRGLMQLWQRIHWSSADGMMPPAELRTVYALAAMWPGTGVTVELGSWRGLTTCYLATACRIRGGGRVFAVDTFEGTREGGARYPSVAKHDGNTRGAFNDQIQRAGVMGLVTPLVGYTHEVVNRYDGGPIRFLLVDADHSYEGVRRDFRLWSPLVEPGGLIVFHDYLMPEVARFVDDDVRTDERFAVVPQHRVDNIVAVRKKPDAEEASLFEVQADRGAARIAPAAGRRGERVVV